MIDRRQAIRLVLAAVPAAVLPQAARAQQSFQRFIPFLIDLSGWKGNKPDGMAMELAGSNMVTATRAYERGEARLNAAILTGMAAQAALAAGSAGNQDRDGRHASEHLDHRRPDGDQDLHGQQQIRGRHGRARAERGVHPGLHQGSRGRGDGARPEVRLEGDAGAGEVGGMNTPPGRCSVADCSARPETPDR
jgi:hypothetical protein